MLKVGRVLRRVDFCVHPLLWWLIGGLDGLQGAPSWGRVVGGDDDMSVARVWWWVGWRRAGFSKSSASGLSMAERRATLRCGLIWFWLGLGIVQAGSVLGHVRSLGRVSIRHMLVMGWAETGMVFSLLGASGLCWLQSSDLALWNYGFGGWSRAACGPGLL